MQHHSGDPDSTSLEKIANLLSQLSKHPRVAASFSHLKNIATAIKEQLSISRVLSISFFSASVLFLGACYYYYPSTRVPTSQALLAQLLAFFGYELSLKTIPPPTSKKLYRITFSFFSLVSLALADYQAVQAEREKEVTGLQLTNLQNHLDRSIAKEKKQLVSSIREFSTKLADVNLLQERIQRMAEMTMTNPAIQLDAKLAILDQQRTNAGALRSEIGKLNSWRANYLSRLRAEHLEQLLHLEQESLERVTNYIISARIFDDAIKRIMEKTQAAAADRKCKVISTYKGMPTDTPTTAQNIDLGNISLRPDTNWTFRIQLISEAKYFRLNVWGIGNSIFAVAWPQGSVELDTPDLNGRIVQQVSGFEENTYATAFDGKLNDFIVNEDVKTLNP